jgi:GNAT superfamily N-acetyltransferase
MTTTLRPAEPERRGADGVRSRRFTVCVNSRPVGGITLGTDARFGPEVGRLDALSIEPADRRRGRAAVAALAAEEVLRGWGCRRIDVAVGRSRHAPARRRAGLRRAQPGHGQAGAGLTCGPSGGQRRPPDERCRIRRLGRA